MAKLTQSRASRVAGLIGSLLVALLLPAATLAAITQGFKTNDSTLVVGSIVSFDQAGNSVTAANTSNVSSLLGVVTDKSTGVVQVATSGVLPVLASNVNGDIKIGDPVTVSTINGIGQRATGDTKIVGLATSTLNAQTAGVVQQNLTDKSGKSHQVSIGAILVTVGVGNYASTAPGSGLVPAGLQNLVNSIAGHSVPPIRVILSVVILVVVLIIIGIIVNSSVRSSLISIGRNPLAGRSLIRGLFQVLLVVLILLGMSFGIVYFIITR